MKSSFVLAALIAGQAFASPASSAEPGLVAYYTFDEGAGSTLRDVSGHGETMGRFMARATSAVGAGMASSSTACATLWTAAAYQPVKDGATIRQGRLSVRVGMQGQVELKVGKDLYLVESAFSHPSERIGWNHLSGAKPGGEAAWSPRVRKISASEVAIEARGEFYVVGL